MKRREVNYKSVVHVRNNEKPIKGIDTRRCNREMAAEEGTLLTCVADWSQEAKGFHWSPKFQNLL